MITCQACGTANPPEAAFCSKCARKLDPVTQAAIVEKRDSHSATGVRWMSILVTAILIIIAAVILAVILAHVA